MHAWAIEGYGAANVGLLGALDDEAIKEIGTLLRYDGRRAATAAEIKFIKKALASEVAEEAQRAAERDKRRTPNTDFTQSRVAGSSNEAADSNDDESAASGGLDGSESDDERSRRAAPAGLPERPRLRRPPALTRDMARRVSARRRREPPPASKRSPICSAGAHARRISMGWAARRKRRLP